MNEKIEATSTVVAQINQVNIVGIENGEKRAATKPIYGALGMDEEAQRQKIQNNVFCGSTTWQRNAVGAHRKYRDRITIPTKYVLGRQFTINCSGMKGGCDD